MNNYAFWCPEENIINFPNAVKGARGIDGRFLLITNTLQQIDLQLNNCTLLCDCPENFDLMFQKVSLN